jgi:protease I
MSSRAAKPVVVLVHDEYQELEFWYPLLRLREEGIEAKVLGVDGNATYVSHLGYPVIPDLSVKDVAPDQVAGVIIPGGGAAARIAQSPVMMDFVKVAAAKGAAIGGIAQAAEVLTKAGLKGRVITAASANDLPAFFRSFSERLTTVNA